MTAEKATGRGGDAEVIPTLSRLRDAGRTVSSPDEDIRGRLVRDEDGRSLGRIKGLLIDDVGREIRFMEVASGGLLGLGERTSFIPVAAITRVTDTHVSISRTGAPPAGPSRYDPDVVPVDPDYAENMYPDLGDRGYLGMFPITRGYPRAMRRNARPRRSDG